MVIQLTEAERAILEQAAIGNIGVPADSSSVFRANLTFLLELQLVMETPEGVQITPLGTRVLRLTRHAPPRR
ncbi:MAG: hypothetical protein M3N82_00655 [Pseudomonadota bacterium]|nr:hypothetical protein [Pseudomonadota bacterium]